MKSLKDKSIVWLGRVQRNTWIVWLNLKKIMSTRNDGGQINIGGGFLSLLTVLFIGLKLTGYIDWSWLWVLAPLWIPLAIVLSIFAVVGIVWLIISVMK